MQWVEEYINDFGLADRVKVLKIWDMSVPRGAAHHTCYLAPVRGGAGCWAIGWCVLSSFSMYRVRGMVPFLEQLAYTHPRPYICCGHGLGLSCGLVGKRSCGIASTIIALTPKMYV